MIRPCRTRNVPPPSWGPQGEIRQRGDLRISRRQPQHCQCEGVVCDSTFFLSYPCRGQFLPVSFHHLRIRWNFPLPGHHMRFQRERAHFSELVEIGPMIEHSGSCPPSPARRITGHLPDRRAQEEGLDIRVSILWSTQYWRQGRCRCVHCTLVRNDRICRWGSLRYSGSLPLVFLCQHR